MALSAWIEITGLAIWAIDLWRAMNTRPAAVSAAGPVEIGPRAKVFDVIQSYPLTKDIFQKYGFSLIHNPLAQRVFARSISLEQACRLKHVDFAVFQSDLTKVVSNPSGDAALPVQATDPRPAKSITQL